MYTFLNVCGTKSCGKVSYFAILLYVKAQHIVHERGHCILVYKQVIKFPKSLVSLKNESRLNVDHKLTVVDITVSRVIRLLKKYGYLWDYLTV